MDLENIDFCLSGLSRSDIDNSFRRMMALDTLAPVSELLIWDLHGGVNRTTFEEGTSMSDMSGVIEIDFTTISRMMVIFHPPITDVSTTMSIAVVASQGRAIIDGQLYVGHLLRAGAALEDVLTQLSELVAKLARQLDAIFLVVADEDDDSSVLNSNGIRLPKLFGVFDSHLIQGVVDGLCSEGAMVKELVNSPFTIVWVEYPEGISSEVKAKPGVLDILSKAMNAV